MSDTLCEALTDHGYEPIAAANGKEALERLRAWNERPSVILLDIAMPVLDGRAFRDAQLAVPELRDIPVIVLTAQPDAEQLCAEMEVNAFLRKPVRLDPLLSLIRRHTDETSWA
ncbi:MAG: response regulator [Kofleriaceae bacterium]|nr:MAG: response regulator [Kofleriaceae bacterium]MBZ0238330.1 response regulator [Kofleriaceae bacterium]